ncbi:unnamed protein product [Cuscuta campestris]|uniref:Uncharacterized protein n=1 Tax=Cuscuta campestris TaxID=132261 RepID=A0A484MQ73_9ASTE|nr:unnamed protein product [Cuscuta campestris]
MNRRNGRSNGRRAESNGRRAESNGRHSSASHQTPPPPSQPVPSPPSPPSPPAQTPPPHPAELAAQSAAYFDDLFGPGSRGMVRSYASSAATNGYHAANGTRAAGNGESSTNRDHNTYQMARNPWQYNSSIFYGGQEDIYVRPRPPPRRPEDDINDETYCNIGDWWKGSYHY